MTWKNKSNLKENGDCINFKDRLNCFSNLKPLVQTRLSKKNSLE